MIPDRLAFVDLETTGGNPAVDRITEIGVVEVDGDRVSTWNTLVNPERPIPEFIQQLTGIRNEMVEGAPTFVQVADELAERLGGRLFIAHNARFDYGFVKGEYQRLGRRFRADVLCTVRLSRRLFPAHPRHNLDSLIARHDLEMGDRHRALADADLIWQFWRAAQRERGADAVAEAIRQELRRPSLPPGLDPALLDDLPESPGAYRFFGESDSLLYVGRSVNLRKQVLSHFAADPRQETRFSNDVRRIDWHETVGELGALLLESRLLKESQPAHNRRLRHAPDPCAWRLEEVAAGDFRPRLVGADEAGFGRGDDLFGPFATRREAGNALRKIADAYALCPALLGLEMRAQSERPCSVLQAQQCKGACVGKEAIGLHSARLMSALAKLKMKPWAYPGPIGLVERNEFLDVEEIHVIDAWCYLGTARDDAGIRELLERGAEVRFDLETYKLLKTQLGKGKLVVRRL